VHLRPDGRDLEALREFRDAGGSGLTLVNLPASDVLSGGLETFLGSYRWTINMAVKAREELGLEVNVAIGPYPVLLLPLAEALGPEKAEAVMIEAVDAAAALVAAGEAQALGELGRPHFPVEPEIVETSNRILAHAMGRASEVGCPLIIHSESAGTEEMAGFAAMADNAGLRRERVLKHFSAPLNRPELSHGLITSVPASRSALREAIANGGPFLLETDYLDDPERPGAVMAIRTVPRRVKAMLASNEMDERLAWEIGQELPRRLYRP